MGCLVLFATMKCAYRFRLPGGGCAVQAMVNLITQSSSCEKAVGFPFSFAMAFDDDSCG